MTIYPFHPLPGSSGELIKVLCKDKIPSYTLILENIFIEVSFFQSIFTLLFAKTVIELIASFNFGLNLYFLISSSGVKTFPALFFKALSKSLTRLRPSCLGLLR